jgi:hypothetical protein
MLAISLGDREAAKPPTQELNRTNRHTCVRLSGDAVCVGGQACLAAKVLLEGDGVRGDVPHHGVRKRAVQVRQGQSRQAPQRAPGGRPAPATLPKAVVRLGRVRE